MSTGGLSRPMEAVTCRPFEFQLQFAVPAEELRYRGSVRDLRRIRCRVQTVLTLATDVGSILEPRGWRLLTVRFEEEVCVVLTRYATAELVARDLGHLPGDVLAEIGHTVHVCVTAGEHIFELMFADGGLRPFSPADSSLPSGVTG